jgi:hemerythrin-like domain-containing protein
MNAITMLKEDHTKVRGLLKELEATTARGRKTRVELLAKIAREIEVHATLEEEIFYPAFKAAGEKGDDDKMYFEALEEHRAAGDLVLPDLLATDPASERFSGRAKVLKELIEHHAGEEEKEMFPRARKLLSAQELDALGARMQQRKQELLAGAGKPKTTTAKLLDAVVGAIAPPPTETATSHAAARKRTAARKSGNGASSGRASP